MKVSFLCSMDEWSVWAGGIKVFIRPSVITAQQAVTRVRTIVGPLFMYYLLVLPHLAKQARVANVREGCKWSNLPSSDAPPASLLLGR